jgi:sigma-B regulation protein RsbU (phosphoserine phosphatase)
MKEAAMMRHLMENIRDNIYFMDREGHISLVSYEGARWLGFDAPEEVIGKTDLDLFSAEHGREAYADGQRIMETGVPILGKEEKETWADGRETWVSTSKMPLRNDEGEIEGIFGISRDITEHKLSEIRAEKLAEENRRFREELEDDLQMAAELQKTFFPTTYPVFQEGGGQVVQFIHKHSSSGLVSGDFCSVRKLSETEAGILLCDVMGHGVRAALGTAIVRAMVEEISHQEKDPAEFLSHMNSALMPILRQGDEFLFATACYMVLDVTSGNLRFASAGHSAPVRVGDGEACFLEGDPAAFGPGLAVAADSEYKTSENVLLPGESVFMFTDGLCEVENDAQEEYGEERLMASAVKSHELDLEPLCFALFDDARAFSSDRKFNDDVCLVGLRYK